MDVISLLAFTCQAANDLVERCDLVQQCHEESGRLALRANYLKDALQKASSNFSADTPGLQASLVQLKSVLERANDLVTRCTRPARASLAARLHKMAKANENKAGIEALERDLERLASDLNIPMLSDIRRGMDTIAKAIEGTRAQDKTTMTSVGADELAQVVRRAVRRELEVQRSASPAPANPPDRAEQTRRLEAPLREDANGRPPGSQVILTSSSRLWAKIGRVRFESLEEGEILGQGTFGTVHAAMYNGDEVAIKKARGEVGDPGLLRDFRREAEIHFAMNHPNIVRVLAFGVDDPSRPLCLVMERMEESLYDYLRERSISPLAKDRLRTISGVCQGLKFLHDMGIIHRDIKSPNVLIHADGSAKLSDFGMATVKSTIASSTGALIRKKVGSEFWMAPEVHEGQEATRASDVFSLHVVMWEVLNHRAAGTGTPIGVRLLSSTWARPLKLASVLDDAHQEKMQLLLDGCGCVRADQRLGMAKVASTVESICEATADDKTIHRTGTTSPLIVQEPTFTVDRIRSRSGARFANNSRPQWLEDPVTPLLGRAPESSSPAQSDRAVLEVLYASTRGATWTKSAGWGTAMPLGEWHGVEVDEEGRVLVLDLRNNNLTGAIPERLGDLHALERLLLVQNKLSGAIPRQLGDLSKLVELHLSGNRLVGPIPAEMGNLTSLNQIWLENNRLSGEIPRELGNLHMLERMSLSANQLSGAIHDDLAGLRALKKLWLYGNNLSSCFEVFIHSSRGGGRELIEARPCFAAGAVADVEGADSGIRLAHVDSIASPSLWAKERREAHFPDKWAITAEYKIVPP